MLLLALSCRHESPPDASVDVQTSVSVAVCDPYAVTHALQRQLGPQRCTTDLECTAHSLSELVPMMPEDERARLRDVDAEPDPMSHSMSLLLGSGTTVTSLVEPAVDLVRACKPANRARSWSPEWSAGTDGVVLFRSARPAESAYFVGADGVTREQCIAEVAGPACIQLVCGWRPETRVVPCSRVSARSSM